LRSQVLREKFVNMWTVVAGKLPTMMDSPMVAPGARLCDRRRTGFRGGRYSKTTTSILRSQRLPIRFHHRLRVRLIFLMPLDALSCTITGSSTLSHLVEQYFLATFWNVAPVSRPMAT